MPYLYPPGPPPHVTNGGDGRTVHVGELIHTILIADSGLRKDQHLVTGCPETICVRIVLTAWCILSSTSACTCIEQASVVAVANIVGEMVRVCGSASALERKSGVDNIVFRAVLVESEIIQFFALDTYRDEVRGG